ncbi:MAG: hypothetical protein J3K34DRAFT_409929 [Monoraphidium minutum]|nr:MAG: hypothetical protein J3K34DRAFT_409929 [Monoraphidium minutum]
MRARGARAAAFGPLLLGPIVTRAAAWRPRGCKQRALAGEMRRTAQHIHKRSTRARRRTLSGCRSVQRGHAARGGA